MRRILDIVILIMTTLLVLAALVFFAFPPRDGWSAGEPDPTLDCAAAGSTVNLSLPKMVAGMAHPEICYNRTVVILDALMGSCSTATTTTLP